MEDSQKQVCLYWTKAFTWHENNDVVAQGAAFTMLKAILSCKMMTSDVYDVMKRVMELLVTCQMDRSPLTLVPHNHRCLIFLLNSVRSQCRACALIYLLRYPLGEKRLRAHMVRHLWAKNEHFFGFVSVTLVTGAAGSKC